MNMQAPVNPKAARVFKTPGVQESILECGNCNCNRLALGVRDGNADLFHTRILRCFSGITVELKMVSRQLDY